MQHKNLLYWLMSHKKLKYGVIAGATFFGAFSTTAFANELAEPVVDNTSIVVSAEKSTGSVVEETKEARQVQKEAVTTLDLEVLQEAEEIAKASEAEAVEETTDSTDELDGEVDTEEVIQGEVVVKESLEPEASAATVEEQEEEPLTAESFTYEDVSKTVYITHSLNVRSGPSTDFDVIGWLAYAEEVEVTGECTETGWYRINYDGQTRYISNKYTSSEKPQSASSSSSSSSSSGSSSSSWTGSKLTKSGGVNYGPSGKETYYNLDMSGVVQIMRNMGNTDEYWVRDDGCKMLGNYIMVAANLSVHPRGSLVETSLGTAIVCDTGGFASSNPNQLDIAVNW